MSTIEEIKTHPAWEQSVKLTYKRDSSIMIMPTHLAKRKMSTTALLNKVEKTVKQQYKDRVRTRYDLGWREAYSFKVYFDFNDGTLYNELMTDFDNPFLEIVEIQTPKNEEHATLLRNIEVGQVVRDKLFWNKYKYSVRLTAPAKDTSFRTYDERQKYAEEARSYFDKNDKFQVEWNHVRVWTNDLDKIMLLRLGLPTDKCDIKEAVIVED